MESLRTLSSLFFFVKPDSVSFELPKQIIGKREQTVKPEGNPVFEQDVYLCQAQCRTSNDLPIGKMLRFVSNHKVFCTVSFRDLVYVHVVTCFFVRCHMVRYWILQFCLVTCHSQCCKLSIPASRTFLVKLCRRLSKLHWPLFYVRSRRQSLWLILGWIGTPLQDVYESTYFEKI